jgi:hypothetical protein
MGWLGRDALEGGRFLVVGTNDPAAELELEVDMPGGQTLRSLVACEGLWRVLKRALPPGP